MVGLDRLVALETIGRLVTRLVELLDLTVRDCEDVAVSRYNDVPSVDRSVGHEPHPPLAADQVNSSSRSR